jgi:hypothetical protein
MQTRPRAQLAGCGEKSATDLVRKIDPRIDFDAIFGFPTLVAIAIIRSKLMKSLAISRWNNLIGGRSAPRSKPRLAYPVVSSMLRLSILG